MLCAKRHTPLWKRGARGDLKDRLFAKIPLSPPLPKGVERKNLKDNPE
jgi:hypothetical protein